MSFFYVFFFFFFFEFLIFLILEDIGGLLIVFGYWGLLMFDICLLCEHCRFMRVSS